VVSAYHRPGDTCHGRPSGHLAKGCHVGSSLDAHVTCVQVFDPDHREALGYEPYSLARYLVVRTE
jgi:hypothetical protein